MLKENLRNVESQIQASCEKSGRQREDVTLIAVSKTKPVELLQEAYDAGVRDSAKTRFRKSVTNMTGCLLISGGI